MSYLITELTNGMWQVAVSCEGLVNGIDWQWTLTWRVGPEELSETIVVGYQACQGLLQGVL